MGVRDDVHEVLVHVRIEDGSVRTRTCPDGNVAAARRFALDLRAGPIPISDSWSMALVAMPPGGFVFDLVHGRGITVSRSWLCFGGDSALFWQRIFDDVSRRDVRAACPAAAPWLATSLRASGLSLLMADDKLKEEADSLVLRGGWALLMEPHGNERTAFPTRKRNEAAARP